MKRLFLAMFATSLLAVDTSWATKTFSYRSRVVDIVDGDTIVISDRVFPHGIKMRPDGPIKLDAVDAPELDQPGGEEAKAFLEELLKGKEIFVVELTDMGQSRGAWVFVDDGKKGDKQTSVNVLMVQKGFAWHTKPKAYYAISSGKPKEAHGQMQKAQEEAKKQKLGIWAAENPVPPWELERQKREHISQQPAEAIKQPEVKPKLTTSNTVETSVVTTRKPAKQSDTQNPPGAESESSKKKVDALTILLSGVAAILAICIAIRLIKKRS